MSVSAFTIVTCTPERQDIKTKRHKGFVSVLNNFPSKDHNSISHVIEYDDGRNISAEGSRGHSAFPETAKECKDT